jgi:hypothetical protein
MLWKRLVIISLCWTYAAGFAFSGECGSPPAKEINIDLWSTRSLLSPDKLWQFICVGPHSSEQKAALYIQNTHSSQEWNVGSIERDGTVFWSEDSRRVFLRDEYAADDTKIRVFDVTDPAPKEIKGLDRRIRRAIFARIPEDEMTLWLKYPQVCFAPHDSSIIIVVADAPLALKMGNGKGKPFRLKLTVNLITAQIVNSIPSEKIMQ